MGDLLIRHYVIAIILFILVSAGSVFLIADFSLTKPSMISDPKYQEFNQSFNKMTDIQEHVTTMKETTTSFNTDFGLFGVLNSLINSAWNALTTIFVSLGFMTDIFNSTTTLLGVPAWITILVGLIPTVIITYLILSAIFQKDV